MTSGFGYALVLLLVWTVSYRGRFRVPFAVGRCFRSLMHDPPLPYTVVYRRGLGIALGFSRNGLGFVLESDRDGVFFRFLSSDGAVFTCGCMTPPSFFWGRFRLPFRVRGLGFA